MWLRKVQVIVTQADDKNKVKVFEHHAIDFEVRSVLGTSADTATISIMNLKVDEVKFLQARKNKTLFIELRAGYVDDIQSNSVINSADGYGLNAKNIEITNSTLPTLFSGIVTNAVGYKNPPEHITTVFCMSKAGQNFSRFMQMNSIPPNSTLDSAIRSMCSDYGFHTISTYGIRPEVLQQVLHDGRTFHDTFLKEFSQLLKEYNLSYYVSTAEIQIFPDTYADKDSVIRMSKIRVPIGIDANKVIGNPQAGVSILNINMFLRPDIEPGMVIDVSSLYSGDTLVNGVIALDSKNVVYNYQDSILRYSMATLYQIESLVHHGGTHRPDFVTSLGCIIPGRNQMGGLEDQWQTWYSHSGMAMIEGATYG